MRPSSGGSGSNALGVGCLVLVGIFVGLYVLGAIGQAYGTGGFVALGLFGTAAIVGIVLLKRHAAEEQRLAAERHAFEKQQEWQAYFGRLVQSYGEYAANMIVAGAPWQGATQPMIHQMLGSPADVSTKVHKASKADTWKYHPIAKNRYALKIFFENGVCTGWETA